MSGIREGQVGQQQHQQQQQRHEDRREVRRRRPSAEKIFRVGAAQARARNGGQRAVGGRMLRVS